MLFWTRFATGIAKANSIPVHQSLIADNYPIGIRARMSAVMNMGAHGIGLVSPVLCAAIATWAGGVEGWRWAWFLLGIPVVLVAVLAFFMKEPPRGQFEKQDVLGEVIEDEQPAPISMEAAFARIKRIRTIRTVLVGVLRARVRAVQHPRARVALPRRNTLHVHNLLERGIILSLSGIFALPILPFVGRYFDRKYRLNPAKALALVGALILPSALLTPLQFSVHSTTWFWILKIPQSVLTASAFAMVGPVLQAVVPYRLRGMGTAMSTLYIFFIGGFMGGLVAAFLTDTIGVRGTVIVLGVPSAIIGGALLMNGARFIRNDLSLNVEELLEEQEEHRKRFVEHEDIPLLQLANIDFSYGPVQVLFGVDFEVRKGETLALLGTNGAGKSTALARDQRARGTRTRRGPAQRSEHHVRLAGAARQVPPHHAAPRRSRRVRQPHGRAEHERERPPQLVGPRRGAAARRERVRAVPRARRPQEAARVEHVGWAATDGRAGAGADPRARAADDRRALTRPGAAGRATAPRARRGAQAAGPDDDHRGAVAQRRDGDRRSRHLPGKG